jgi:hypothetical protein
LGALQASFEGLIKVFQKKLGFFIDVPYICFPDAENRYSFLKTKLYIAQYQ